MPRIKLRPALLKASALSPLMSPAPGACFLYLAECLPLWNREQISRVGNHCLGPVEAGIPLPAGLSNLLSGVQSLYATEKPLAGSVPHFQLEASLTYPFGLTKLPSLVSLELKDQNIKRD